MFTGIVEKTSKVVFLQNRGKEYELKLVNPFGLTVSVGDSIAIDGVCLTAEKVSIDEFSFFISLETVKTTIVSKYCVGVEVNLERAMRADGRFDGHIVQGHVDTVGTVSAIKDISKGKEILLNFDRSFKDYIVPRGSVCVNGVSLTTFSVTESSFSISIIPETFKRTSFISSMKSGIKVNLEFDILGKYVARIMENKSKGSNLQSLLEKL